MLVEKMRTDFKRDDAKMSITESYSIRLQNQSEVRGIF